MGMYEARRHLDDLVFLRPWFSNWKKLKAFLVAVKSAQVRKAAHLEVVRVEGALSSFLKHLKYLPTDPKKVDRFVKITVASLTEFIRVHRNGLKKLDPNSTRRRVALGMQMSPT